MDYTQHFSLRSTPQTQPIPNKDMVENNAGGYTFKIDKWSKLDRFLLLGTEGGTYYTSEQKLTKENAKNVIECIQQDGEKTIQKILEVSIAGRAMKNDPAIFALALTLTFGNEPTKKLGYHSIPRICRIGTHLFTLCTAIQNLRGWSGGLRKAIERYYTSKTTDNLVYDLLKYQSRNGFSHRDVLRLAHIKPKTDNQKHILGYAVGKDAQENIMAHPMIEAVYSLKTETDVKKVIQKIIDHKLPREVIPTQFLNEKGVWEAMLPNMPMMAMIRNLGKMSSIGLLPNTSFSINAQEVITTLLNEEKVRKSRVHPISILQALKVYGLGRGVKGSLTWEPHKKIMDALNDAFYLSFANVHPTNKNILLALDVSGSMSTPIDNSVLSSREVTAAFAMVTARTEPNYEIMGFSSQFIPLNITAKDNLTTVLKKISGLPFESTDCALPMMYALKNQLSVDVFGIYTDNETYFGKIHPKEALDRYRRAFNPQAKCYVMATEATDFTIADPDDSGMIDIAGFDSNLPQLIDWFIRGE